MTRSTGTPTWIDFNTTDMATTKAFYEGLFGWDFHDSGEAMGHYQMIFKDGALIGGGMDTNGMAGPDGSPMASEWCVYLAVDDVDARLKLAEENGAQVVVPADNAGDAGRFAVIIDPTGAALGLWQAGDTEGYEFSGNPGTPLWFELMTQDIEKAREFYTKVFDFDPQGMPGHEDTYFTNGSMDQASSGIVNAEGFIPAEMGSYWRLHLGVENCDEAVEKVKELGGKLLDGPDDSPFGRIATVAEPTGATFQISAPSQAVHG